MSDGVRTKDDLPHPVGADPTFSESLYYQFGDPASGLNGFLRLANRPNEGKGERTACLFLPDGGVALSFARPAFADAGVFAAGGMQVDVKEPLVSHAVSFDGEVSVLTDGWAMTDPRTALESSPIAPCSIELEVEATAPAVAFSLDDHGDFAAHHFDQFVAVHGRISLGDEEILVRAHGMRDRGWGPRSWQAPSFYRWMFGTSGGFSFAAGVLGRGGAVRTGGFVWDGGRMHALDLVLPQTSYDGDGLASVSLELKGEERSWRVEGVATNAVPLRNRRPGADTVTRILETSVRWTHDGVVMAGIAEYLDQLVDGRPVGIAGYDQLVGTPAARPA